MATDPIYVETEEEIPELVERLRRYRGDDTMLVLPMRSRIGQSRFNFQLLRNYAARMGKRVTVVCDDPAVQKRASESGFPVFGAGGPLGAGRAQPFSQRDVEIQAQPGKPPIRVRVSVVSRSDSQGFKTTGVKQVQLTPATGVVTYTNELKGGFGSGPGIVFKVGQRLTNTNGIVFAQTSDLPPWGGVMVPWQGTASANVQAVNPGVSGNVGGNTITVIDDCCGPFDPSKL